tara:strand:- start:203 stop:1144 length:942 start_codon:yes stop_codon:yes gene_type:complete
VNIFSPIKPFLEFSLDVGDGHSLYVEISGNENGIPVLFLHGGPGAGSSELFRRYFDPKKYKIIIFDQRGCGKSTPFGACENNTSDKLVDDIKQILLHLNIKQVVIYGGSWGSTLALLFSEKYPQSVKALVLRGIFLCRESDIQWFYQKGADSIFPDYWRDFIKDIPTTEMDDILTAFYNRIHSQDLQISNQFCKQWSIWEGNCSSLRPNKKVVELFDKCAISLAKIETHFFKNNCFIEENQIIKNIEKIKNIKCFIIHGRYDIVCPFNQAFDLHNHYDNSELNIINDAGHSLLEPGITKKILQIFEEPSNFDC